MRIKYFAQYEGPSYSSWGMERLEGFHSLYEAMEAVRARQKYECDGVNEYVEAPDGYHRESEERFVRFPATTREDKMYIYWAVWDGDEEGYQYGDLAYLITVGPKGGVEAKKA